MSETRFDTSFRPVFFPRTNEVLDFCPDGTIKRSGVDVDFEDLTDELVDSVASEDRNFVKLFLATMEH